MGVKKVIAIATAACRDAKNGARLHQARRAHCRREIDVLSGAREAELTALGVVSGVHRPTVWSAISAAARSSLSTSTAGACGTA